MFKILKTLKMATSSSTSPLASPLRSLQTALKILPDPNKAALTLLFMHMAHLVVKALTTAVTTNQHL
jgi:hypothetical protein